MSYRLDLDEQDQKNLTNELHNREKKRLGGLCDYCGRPVGIKPSCKEIGRHNHKTGAIERRHFVAAAAGYEARRALKAATIVPWSKAGYVLHAVLARYAQQIETKATIAEDRACWGAAFVSAVEAVLEQWWMP